MRIQFVTLLLLIASLAAAGQDNLPSANKETLLARALKAMEYGPSFKQGLAAEKKQSGKTTAFIERALAADDSAIESIFAHVYAAQLSDAQVTELVRFYESSAGRALVAQQARNALDPNPPLRLTQEQATEARAFTNSDAGRVFKRVSEDEMLMQQVGAALQKALLAH
jgi:hypothetical protein